MTDATKQARPYWAAEPDIKELAPRLLERFMLHMRSLDRSGRWSRMRAMLSSYYGTGTDGARDSSAVIDAGEDGEVQELYINQVRPVVTTALGLIAVEVEMKPRPRNEDAKSLASVRLASSLMTAYEDETGGQTTKMQAALGALLSSSWSVVQEWRPTDGKEWARSPEGRPVYEGDASFMALPPWRIVYDFAALAAEKRKWCFFRRPMARFDLAAQFREAGEDEKAKRIETMDAEMTPQWVRWLGADFAASVRTLDVLLGEELPPEDVVWVWELRHIPSPALPQGRLVRFIEPDIVLWDSLALGVDYPYEKDELHAYEYCPERVVAGTAGHTAAFDLGAIQEMLDVAHSSMASRLNILGQIHIYGGQKNPETYALGQNATVFVGPDAPQVLEHSAMDPAVPTLADYFKASAAQAFALNNVVMGNPEKGMPASAQALQRAQAQQFHAVSQAEWVRFNKRFALGLLKLLKRFAKSPRVARLAGNARLYEVKEWQSDDLQLTETVDVEPVNPQSSTFEGRQATLELLKETGQPLPPDAILTFLQTGSLATITQSQTLDRELVEANVALLQRGIGPPQVDIQASLAAGAPQFIEPPPGTEVLRIMKSDPHHLAIPAYRGVLSSPATRGDVALVKACTEAIQLSMQYWAQLTPDECAAFGVPPLPTSMAMMGMGPPPPSGEEAPPEPGGPPPGMVDENPELPAPPEDPLTGAQPDASATGLVQ